MSPRLDRELPWLAGVLAALLVAGAVGALGPGEGTADFLARSRAAMIEALLPL